MKTRRALLFSTMPAVLGLSNCMMFHKTSPGFHPVWTPNDGAWPAKSLAAPAGFTLTPYQAYEITRESRSLSLKHRWDLYADSRYYYVHDTFLGDSPKEAHKYGLCIDGRTGKIEKNLPR
jgi:hypothetical protein